MELAKIINNNTIIVYDLSQFDMHAIMHSGQVFRYFEINNGYELVVGSHFVHLYKDNDNIIIKCDDADYFFNYFDLSQDYNEIKKRIGENICFAPIIETSGGIRILKGEFIEMVISFIISANNNIKRFTKTLNLLSEKFGEKLKNGRYSFPALSDLQNIDESSFKEFGCGYRSSYLVKAIQQLKDLDLEFLKTLSNDQLMHVLLKIQGVGKKVASCIMLFCFHRLDIAPIDTWIHKAIDKLGDDKNLLLNHQYAGVYQQYVFHHLQYLKKDIS
ncbi:MAG: hypothetical protein FWE03_00690 [Firmicutes bacterium]|nr:hypothetical protein [Bacillota bacterium]